MLFRSESDAEDAKQILSSDFSESLENELAVDEGKDVLQIGLCMSGYTF